MAKRVVGTPVKPAIAMSGQQLDYSAPPSSSPEHARIAASKATIRVKRPPRSPVPAGKSPEDLQTIFGDNFRRARLNCRLKQSEVADRTGLTQQYLSLIEAGQQNITLKTMVLLAEIVGHDVAAMLRRDLK
jgi:DNA-binding XRE family transcriptional regulator